MSQPSSTNSSLVRFCIKSKHVWISEKQEFLEAAIFVKGEYIEDVYLASTHSQIIKKLIEDNDLSVLDYDEKYIMPGLIDTNVSLHIGNQWEEIEKTTKLFAMGGVTTIVCSPLLMNPQYLRDEYSSIQMKTKKIQGKAAVDYCFFANLYEENIQDIPKLHNQPGVVGFKIYLNPPMEPGAGWIESKKQMNDVASAIAALEQPQITNISSSNHFNAPSSEVLLSFHAIKSGGKELTITSPLRQHRVKDRLGASVKRTEGDSVLGEASKKKNKNMQDEFSDDNDTECITMSQISNCVNDNILDLNGEVEEDNDGETIKIPFENQENINSQSTSNNTDVINGDTKVNQFQQASDYQPDSFKTNTHQEFQKVDSNLGSPQTKASNEQTNRQKLLKLYAKATIHSSDNLQQQLIARAEMKTYSKDFPQGENESDAIAKESSGRSSRSSSSSSSSNTNSSSNSSNENQRREEEEEDYSDHNTSEDDDDDYDDDDDNSSLGSSSIIATRFRHKSCSASNFQDIHYFKNHRRESLKQPLHFKESNSIELKSSLCSPMSMSTNRSSPTQSDSNFSQRRLRKPSNESEPEIGNETLIPFPSVNADSYSFDLSPDNNMLSSNFNNSSQSEIQGSIKHNSKLIKIQRVAMDNEQEFSNQTNSIVLNTKSVLEEEQNGGVSSLQQIDEQHDSDPDEHQQQTLQTNVQHVSTNKQEDDSFKSTLVNFEDNNTSPQIIKKQTSNSPFHPTETTVSSDINLSTSNSTQAENQKAHLTNITISLDVENIKLFDEKSDQTNTPSQSSQQSATPTKERNKQSESSKSPSQIIQERKGSNYLMKRPMKLISNIKRGSLEQIPTINQSSPFNQRSPQKSIMARKVFDKKDSSELELTQESDSDKLTRSSVEENMVALPQTVVAPTCINTGPRVAFSEKRRSINLSVAVDLTKQQRKESMPQNLKSYLPIDLTALVMKSTTEIPSENLSTVAAVVDSQNSSEYDQNNSGNPSSNKASIISEPSWRRKTSSESCTSLIGSKKRNLHPQQEEQKDNQSQPAQSFNRDYLTFLAFRPHYWEYSGVRLIKEQLMRPLSQTTPKLNKIKILVQNVCNSNSIYRITQMKQYLAQKKADRVYVYAETAASFLYFNSDHIRNGETKFKCEPPIGSKDNMEFLVNASKLNMIDIISSFHFSVEQQFKEIQGGDFRKAFSGITTAGCTLQATWTALYSSYKKNTQMDTTQSLILFKSKDPNNTPERKIQALLKFVVHMTSAKPARVLNIAHMKGSITKGKYADLVVWDPFQEETKIKIPHRYRFQSVHIFHRKKVTGKVYATFLRGQLIYRAEPEEELHSSMVLKSIPLYGKLLTKHGVIEEHDL